jgi:hypothetical protein
MEHAVRYEIDAAGTDVTCYALPTGEVHPGVRENAFFLTTRQETPSVLDAALESYAESSVPVVSGRRILFLAERMSRVNPGQLS